MYSLILVMGFFSNNVFRYSFFVALFYKERETTSDVYAELFIVYDNSKANQLRIN